MALDLFQHNQTAYEAASTLMDEEGKAAVIHPTGTGKSMIAFKLAEEHPESHILWMAPSEYIFLTQLENVKNILDENVISNITFLTYAKLMMDEEIIEQLLPDYIILDEFHRCGAAEWGKSVNKLLAAYPKAKILGLSATNIRYLDGQRDMAEEIFDGQIASEMTLGEAIVRKILPTPQYVTSLYSYQKELERYRKKVASIKNPVQQKQSEEILKLLKRTLENAKGLPQIFAENMKKKDGKYIVFCMDREHMQDMTEKASEWFSQVDKEPHIYRAYYSNPEVSEEFTSFRKDHSNHLKLLYCIDMLNEGVHVEDVDGVILLRPTISPILYLQQIGRCLSTGKEKDPVIFDVVNNFDSLYTIDSLKKEIEESFSLINCTRAERQKYMDHFHITEEIRNCRTLFEQLKKNLSASWDTYYFAAEAYFKENGHLKIPKNYVTAQGLNLGSWLLTQKRVHEGKVAGNLTEEQSKKLEAIGMVWDSSAKQSFDRGYEELKKYAAQYKNADVKADYVTENGFRLGSWIGNLRQKYANHSDTLTEEQIASLNELGMIWDKRKDQWNTNYQAARAYYEANGNLDVPHHYVTEDGIKLGVWVANQRQNFTGRKKNSVPLTEEQIKSLNEIGMNWGNKYAGQWQEKYELARQFYEKNGHLDIPYDYCIDGVELGKWIASIRLKRNNPDSSGRKLTKERIRQLDEIGMIWNRDAWEVRYRLATDYYQEHGDLKIPANFVTENRIWLGKWVYEQRKSYKNRTLSLNRQQKLEQIGIEWSR